jgi:hypothetical protein
MKTFLWVSFLASMLVAPCYAGELDGSGAATQFYVRVPLGAAAPKERTPSFGFVIRGRQDYQVFTLDSRMLTSRSYDGGLVAGLIEAKWLLVGGAAAVGAVAVAKKGGGGSSAGPTKQGTPPAPQPDKPADPCTCCLKSKGSSQGPPLAGLVVSTEDFSGRLKGAADSKIEIENRRA